MNIVELGFIMYSSHLAQEFFLMVAQCPLEEKRKNCGLSLYHKIVISLYPSSRRRKGVWDKCNAKTKCKFIAAFSSLAQFEDLNAPPPSCENGIQGKSCQLSSREPRNNFSQVALSDELDPVLIGFQYYSS